MHKWWQYSVLDFGWWLVMRREDGSQVKLAGPFDDGRELELAKAFHGVTTTSPLRA